MRPSNCLSKYICDYALLKTLLLEATQLKYAKQAILRDLHQCLGNEPLTEHKLQYSPRWFDDAIEKEQACYQEQNASQPVPIYSLTPSANLILSHYVFVTKHEGECNALKLKCRLVSQGNKNNGKHDLHSYSSISQFRTIRLPLAVAMLFQFSLASLDVDSAC